MFYFIDFVNYAIIHFRPFAIVTVIYVAGPCESVQELSSVLNCQVGGPINSHPDRTDKQCSST